MSTYFEILQAEFPYIRALDVEFYTEEPYKSNSLRRCKALVFLGALSNYEPFRDLHPLEQNSMVKKIESGCVKFTIKKAKEDNIQRSWQTVVFVRRYNNIVHEKANELDFRSNQYLVVKVVAGEIPAASVGCITSEECDPDRDQRLKDKSEIRKNQKIQRKVVTGYLCPECKPDRTKIYADKDKECWVENVQLRGLDESKSTRVTCCNCEHIWIEEK